MKVCGIICEYNPFHNGHIHHIKKTKEITNCDVLVCIMSSQFVQRGEPAITSKWERAKSAVENGCDIVFELPFIYSTQSANYFAKASIQCLKLADVDCIVFGSESNNIEVLKKLAAFDDQDFSEFTKEGLSSAKAYERIYGSWQANDILGIQYIKELEGSKIMPYTIQRTNRYTDEILHTEISSATAIRKAIDEKQDYHTQTPMKHLTNIFHLRCYFPLIRTLLLTLDTTYLSELFLMDEGIENHLIKCVKHANNYEDFMTNCISKRYTRSKIQRTLIHLMNQTKKSVVNHLPPLQHLRILAYNQNGQQYLKKLKEKDVIIASKFNQIPQPYRDMENKATAVYAYPLHELAKEKMMKSELQSPIYINKEET